jgi:hypothetical protein
VGTRVGLDRCGKSRPTGIRSPDLPARSESLYRLSYPGSLGINKEIFIFNRFSRTSLVSLRTQQSLL